MCAFDEGHIVVCSGKGDNDRITVLPDKCRELLIEQVERVRRQHNRDLSDGFGRVYLPYALARKYPNEDRAATCAGEKIRVATPSPNAVKDFSTRKKAICRSRSRETSEAFHGKCPNSYESGYKMRHHVGEEYFGEFFKVAIAQASQKTPCPILCATALRLICWKAGRTFAPCRSYWVIKMFRRRCGICIA